MARVSSRYSFKCSNDIRLHYKNLSSKVHENNQSLTLFFFLWEIMLNVIKELSADFKIWDRI